MCFNNVNYVSLTLASLELLDKLELLLSEPELLELEDRWPNGPPWTLLFYIIHFFSFSGLLVSRSDLIIDVQQSLFLNSQLLILSFFFRIFNIIGWFWWCPWYTRIRFTAPKYFDFTAPNYFYRMLYRYFSIPSVKDSFKFLCQNENIVFWLIVK